MQIKIPSLSHKKNNYLGERFKREIVRGHREGGLLIVFETVFLRPANNVLVCRLIKKSRFPEKSFSWPL